MKRRRLLAAVRDRMRHQAAVREADADRPARAPVPAAARMQPAAPDLRLEQLEAEARYHRDRFELYRARVVSGSAAATSLGRLRELERTATAAHERFAHARRERDDLYRGEDVRG